MSSETEILIQQLHRVEKLLGDLKKEESLTSEDWKIYSVAEKYFGEKYFFENNYPSFLKNLPISAVSDYILELKKEEQDEAQKETRPKEQESSIPPELESLVAEYQHNQTLLNDEEIRSSSQKTVAEQVKIAIAHSKIKKLAFANKERRSPKEKFQSQDEVFATIGSPKSGSKNAALATSYKAVQQVAFTYSGFSKLPPKIQNEIITSAVELNFIGISDIDTAIQSSALQIDVSSLDEKDKNNLATIPGGFISSVYQEVTVLNNKTLEYEAEISENEQELISLQEEIITLSGAKKIDKSIEIKNLIAENEHLLDSIEGQSTRFINSVSKKTEQFRDFEKSREKRLSQDPDLKDKIELAKKNISSIQGNFETNNVNSQLPTPMDDAHLLEKALRQNIPGVLLPHSGYEAEYAAGLINNQKTQNPTLSPQAILLYGKGLTPKLLAQARLFAKNNPESALGKLFSKRKDLFDSAGSELRKIDKSPLAKEISSTKTGIGKSFDSVSKFFGKVSDKIPGGFGTIFRVVQDPWGTLRSWAGRKAGEFISKKLIQSLTNETLKKGAEMLLKDGLKGSLKKLAQQAAAKAAVKAGAKASIKVALETGAQAANIVPGLGLLLAAAIDIIFWIGEKIVGFVKALNRSIYGDDIKTRDYLVIPALAITTVAGRLSSFFSTIGTATVSAAGSAAVTIVIGIIVVFFIYITSIVVAPLISTLVQLESTTRTSTATGCASWPTAGEYVLLQGPLGTSTHLKYKNQAIDISASNNSEFLVAAPGVVIFTGPRGTYGNTAIITAQTENGTIPMLYAHMNDVYVQVGQVVDVGEVVGSVGGTGGWRPHIHFEYTGGVEYNSCPAGDIPVPEGCFGNCLYNGQEIITNVTLP